MFREYCRRTGILLGGLLVSAVGITMMLQANVGLEPWSVLQNGMSIFFGITYGTAAMIVGAAVIAGRHRGRPLHTCRETAQIKQTENSP